MTEVVIYHSYTAFRGNGGILLRLAKMLALVGVGLILWVYAPSVWFWALNGLRTTVDGYRLSKTEVSELSAVSGRPKAVYTPRFDPTLPSQSWIAIPAIGVDSALQEATYNNYEEALKKGVWRVSDFGTPTDNSRPIIMAAHRFGYLAWSNIFRRKSSFYNLPKLEVGDTVEVTWRQRKYVYEVYAKGEGEEITDYSADLILYTCEKLNGPIRIFRYARLLEV